MHASPGTSRTSSPGLGSDGGGGKDCDLFYLVLQARPHLAWGKMVKVRPHSENSISIKIASLGKLFARIYVSNSRKV